MTHATCLGIPRGSRSAIFTGATYPGSGSVGCRVVVSFTELTTSSLEAVTAALPGGGERRHGQTDMARYVAEAIESDGHAIVQAGTGTGKSLAYLVPAVLSDRPTIIATATKALQDQLANKDLPFLAEQLDASFTFAVLKGRSNYLCLQRLDEIEADDHLDLDLDDDTDDGTSGTVDGETLVKLRTFAAETEVGDRAELDWISDRDWRQVSVGRDECPGAGRCPQGDECLAEKARHKAAGADVLVVNLHLYALAITVDTILPEHDVVIIDEAHQLEDIVAEAAGRQISPARVHAAARNAQAVLVERDAPEAAEAAAVGTPHFYEMNPEEARENRRKAYVHSDKRETFSIPGRGEHDVWHPIRFAKWTPSEEKWPDGPRGIYLLFHGGGWVFGDACGQNDVRLEEMSEELGLVVLVPDYSKAPEHPYPAAVNECELAAIWVEENAE